MKIKKYFLYGLTATTLLILGSQNDANASLKNQFKQRSGCSWETAQYQRGPEEWGDFGTKTTRFCLTGDKRVIKYFMTSDDMKVSKGFTLKGFIGESEAWFSNYDGWNQNELSIEGDELVSYSCVRANAYDCGTSTPKRVVLGTKGISQPFKNQNNKVSINSSELRNGLDTVIYDNGDKYSGNWVNGKQDGRGTYTWAGGDKYEGDWKNGNRTGQGTYTWANGDKYEGDWKNSERTGKGAFTWADGRKYVGDFVDGTLEGEGIYTLLNGDIYEGKFENNNFVKSYKVNESNIPTTTSSNNSTEEKPNFQNLEKEVKGMFKNFF